MIQLTASPPATKGLCLVVKVDPRTVPRGHRALPRGGVHATDRKANRASAKRHWQRQMSREAGAAGMGCEIGLLV